MFTRSLYAVLLFAFVCFLAACDKLGPLPKLPWEPSKAVTVTVLHTNDSHSQLEPMRVSGEPEQGGAARRAALIEQIRKEKGSENVLLLSGGDYFQGSLFYNAWKGSAEIMAMNAMRYDAATLGNHEFDLGPHELARALRGGEVDINGKTYETERARFIVVGSNVNIDNFPDLKGLVVKRAIIKKGDASYGFVGVTTESTETISSPGDVLFDDYVTAVQEQVDLLEEAGINKIFLMSHAAYEVDVKKVPELSGVDVVISGHDHALLGNPEEIKAMGLAKQAERVKGPYPTIVKDKDGHNVVVVSAMEKGRWLGNIDIRFDGHGIIRDGAWNAHPIFMRGCDYAGEGEAQTADCTKAIALENPKLAKKIARYHEPIAVFAEEIMGEAGQAFGGQHDERANVAPMGELVADVLLDYTKDSDGAVVAAVNRGGIRSSLEKGTVRFKDINAVLPFPNTVTVLELTGKELVEAMDNGLTQAHGQSYGAFPHVSGMQIHYCTTLPCEDALLPKGVVTQLTIAGEPVDMRKSYRLATSDYQAGGGDFYAVFKQACERAEGYCRNTGTLLKDVVSDWFRSHSPVMAHKGEPRLIPAP